MDNSQKPKNIPAAPKKDFFQNLKDKRGELFELEKDKKYQALKFEYQHANWNKCHQLLAELQNKNLENPILLDFEKELGIQESIFLEEQQQARTAKNTRTIKKTELTLIIIGLIIIVVTLICGGLSIFFSRQVQQEEQNKANQFNLIAGQVESLLISGQPEKTTDLMQQLVALDPANPRIADLEENIGQLTELNLQYEKAVTKINDNQYVWALLDLQEIEQIKPGYRDVLLLIQTAQNRIDIEKALHDATAAYDGENWQEAIDGFELILTLDPAYDDADMANLLLHAYLKRIIQMLESESTTVEDIDTAEAYYRKAVAMIPQSRIFLSERENLQEISSSLLELKYTQTALNLVIDPYQNQGSINKAVAYLNKAINLNPQNTVLQSEVTKVELYQIGFQYYLQMDWASAIENLSQLMNLDENYANGYAKQLLYESHMGRGASYFSVGLYPDARKEYEAAEINAWDMENSAALFASEINLGRTLGKLKDYKSAASYYKYAYEMVDFSVRASSFPDFVNQVRSAIQLFNEGKYQEANALFDEYRLQNHLLFTETTMEIKANTCLGILAAYSNSAAQIILERNDLPRQTTLVSDREIIISTMP